ncbi:DUF1127 domain-containing protein [Microvirga sp. TS319]|uniref:DUF1127 domain-containing protein n=1 Tax=Microvirga sp. TS319 TaxID=3241165 RepID=UPI003519F72B
MSRSAAPILISPVSLMLGRLLRALVSFARAVGDRREVKHLAEFDERMLKDIGLTRGDVESALMEPIHHRPSSMLVRCVETSARHMDLPPPHASHGRWTRA